MSRFIVPGETQSRLNEIESLETERLRQEERYSLMRSKKATRTAFCLGFALAGMISCAVNYYAKSTPLGAVKAYEADLNSDDIPDVILKGSYGHRTELCGRRSKGLIEYVSCDAR